MFHVRFPLCLNPSGHGNCLREASVDPPRRHGNSTITFVHIAIFKVLVRFRELLVIVRWIVGTADSSRKRRAVDVPAIVPLASSTVAHDGPKSGSSGASSRIRSIR